MNIGIKKLFYILSIGIFLGIIGTVAAKQYFKHNRNAKSKFEIAKNKMAGIIHHNLGNKYFGGINFSNILNILKHKINVKYDIAERISKNDFTCISNSFTNLRHQLFIDFIESYGASKKNVFSNVNISGLDIDTYYDDGVNKIAIIWQKINEYIYPNSVNKTKKEFEEWKNIKQLTMKLIEGAGINVIYAPCTVDSVTPDEESPNGFKFEKFSNTDREKRIKNFYREEITKIANAKFLM